VTFEVITIKVIKHVYMQEEYKKACIYTN